jgi:hypothetical protein
MVKGAAQLFPSSREEKLPITRQILDHIITPFADTRSISEANLNAAFTLAHGGFLRMGEFTVDPKDTQATIATRKLTRGDVLIAEDESYVQVRLKASKSDRYREGVTIYIAAAPANCPVRCLRRLLELDPTTSPTQPLFRLETGPFVKAGSQGVVARLKSRLRGAGLDGSKYSGHSFRKGAAQDAHDNGLTKHDIQVLGRWKSDAVDRYYKLSPQRVLTLSFQHQRGQIPNLTQAQQYGLTLAQKHRA